MILILRSWDKEEFLVHLALLGAKIGAEVGVWKGDFSCLMLRQIPELKLYLIDPWKALPKEEYDDVATDVSESAFEYMYQMVRALVKPYPNVEILRMRSLEALSCVADESLDFVYIDANHKFEQVKADIEGWWKKIKKRGILSGHDFDFGHWGVIRAIQCLETFQVKNVFYLKPDDIWFAVKP